MRTGTEDATNTDTDEGKGTRDRRRDAWALKRSETLGLGIAETDRYANCFCACCSAFGICGRTAASRSFGRSQSTITKHPSNFCSHRPISHTRDTVHGTRTQARRRSRTCVDPVSSSARYPASRSVTRRAVVRLAGGDVLRLWATGGRKHIRSCDSFFGFGVWASGNSQMLRPTTRKLVVPGFLPFARRGRVTHLSPGSPSLLEMERRHLHWNPLSSMHHFDDRKANTCSTSRLKTLAFTQMTPSRQPPSWYRAQ